VLRTLRIALILVLAAAFCHLGMAQEAPAPFAELQKKMALADKALADSLSLWESTRGTFAVLKKVIDDKGASREEVGAATEEFWAAYDAQRKRHAPVQRAFSEVHPMYFAAYTAFNKAEREYFNGWARDFGKKSRDVEHFLDGGINTKLEALKRLLLPPK